MISVLNRLPQLSGNRWLLVLSAALFIGACSPKVRRVTPPPPAVPIAVNPPAPKTAPAPPAKTSSIAMLLPFNLDKLNGAEHYSHSGLIEADMSLDYYQGFKLALDSLTSMGYNYRLQLFDTMDKYSQAHNLANNAAVRNSDLIVGPVFPDALQAFTSMTPSVRKPIVSPLSPASPATFRNQNLITVSTPLEYHAWAAARYINDRLKPQKIYILSSGYSEEKNYIVPFKKAIDSLSNKQIHIISLTVVRGQLAPIIPQLSLTGKNIFLMPSTNQAFLMVTLHALDTLGKKYPVILFGHPNWAKYTFLKYETLQRLKTRITASDRINYKAPGVVSFARVYFKTYHVEPTSYAVKGFDEGMYFGLLLGKNTDMLAKLDQNPFSGMHNDFQFIKKPGLGWVNTHVDILEYINFELRKIE
jgi:hypothetical protein